MASRARIRRNGTFGAFAKVAALALVAGFALPASGSASIVSEYQTNGKIDACSHSLGELQAAKSGQGSDSAQYTPEVADAIDSAIAQRGSCASSSSGSDKKSTAAVGGSGSSNDSSGGAASKNSSSSDRKSRANGSSSRSRSEERSKAKAKAAEEKADSINVSSTSVPAVDTTNPASGNTWAILIGGIVGIALMAWALVFASSRIQALRPLGDAIGEAGWRVGALSQELREAVRSRRR